MPSRLGGILKGSAHLKYSLALDALDLRHPRLSQHPGRLMGSGKPILLDPLADFLYMDGGTILTQKYSSIFSIKFKNGISHVPSFNG
jgi:hypothetical protein